MSVAGGRIIAGSEAGFMPERILDVAKASRQRRLKKNRERQRQRASQAASSARPGLEYQPGPRRVPAEKELVASLIGEAVHAVCGGNQDVYGSCLQQLANERTPGWTRAVSRSLVEFLRSSVTAAWRHGWQPAELARHVGRQLSGTHLSITADMIAAEMHGYAVATVDARWAAQVASLGAASLGATASEAATFGTGGAGNGTWWGSDAEYLGAWRVRGLADAGLRGVIADAIETLHALQHLAVLERLLPLPGTARLTAQERAEPTDERLLGKIRALLAKAESTEFAEEAEALSARAQELMAKYSIDHALLAAESGHTEEPRGRRIAVDNPYEAPKASLLQTVAQANRCRIIWSKELGLVTVIGFPADLDAVELLFTSLLVQANSAMLRAGAKRDSYGRSRTRAFRQSFLVSYAIRIGERLSEATGQAEQQAAAQQATAGTGGKDLVPFLAARHRAVDEAVDAMFGDTLTRSRAVRATDAEGWHSGRVAADMASLHNHAAVVGTASA
jgi:Protein of unknown function (DUF2786)